MARSTPEPPRRRRGTLEPQREALVSWIREEIPTTRMLELARQDPGAPYAGGVSTFYRFVARLRAEVEAGAASIAEGPHLVCRGACGR